MKKISDFIVEKRNYILVLFIILSGISIFLATKVNINNDIMKYLPKTSETKIGNDIMENDFERQKSSTLNVMFKNLDEDEKQDKLEKLKEIDGVSEVEYEDTDEYNKDKYTLYVVNVDDYDDSETAANVYEAVKELKPKATSGSIHDSNATVLQLWIVALAIAIAMVILVILNDSYVEPFLYLAAIGIAVFINKGTNIIFSSVSNITDSITAILQLALSMDYSIMLSNRFKQEKKNYEDPKEAMKVALHASFSSISSSSVTTVVGLLALVFMSFTIGKDLGIVLAKGVILSLVSIFFCLPGLLLLFDKLIEKTQKKSLNINLTKLGNFSYKTRYAQFIIFIAVFIIAFLGKGHLGILYTSSEQDEVGKIFPATNQMAIVYKNEYEDLIASYCKELESDEKIDQVLCYGNTINEKLAYDELNAKFKDLGQDTEIEEYLIKLIYYNYYNNDSKNSMTFNEFVNFIKQDIYTNDELSKNIDQETRDNIALLENFTTINNINKPRTAKELSEILDTDEHDIEQLIILYNSKNTLNTKLTLREFVNFMYKDVLTNDEYKNSVDSKTQESLKQLDEFTNKDKIQKQLTSSEMTSYINNILGSNIIDNETMSSLYLLYSSNYNTNSKLSLNEFANFSLQLAQNETFKSQFDDATITQLKQLQSFSNNDLNNKKMTAKEMTEYFSYYNIPYTTINAVYEYYKISNKVEIPSTTIDKVIEIINSDEVKDIITDEKTQQTIAMVKEIIIDKKLSKEEVKNSPIIKYLGIDEKVIDQIYQENNKDELTIAEIVDTINRTNIITEDEKKQKLNEINELITKVVVNSNLPADEIEKILNIKDEVVKDIINKGLLEDVSLTPNEFITFLTNENNSKLLNSVDKNISSQLLLAKSIMSNATNKYTYTELANYLSKLTNSDSQEAKFKTIYGVYYYQTNNVKISPYTLVNFVLDNKSNPLLETKIKPFLSSLQLADKVMESTINNVKYSASSLSNELKIDKDKISLLYSLYNHLYEHNNDQISLNNFIKFALNNVVNDPEYSDRFDDEKVTKLEVASGIINATINSTQYNSSEIYAILKQLSDNLDSNLIDLVYMYHGSVNNYDSSWKMTVEGFVNYLNEDILTDSRFDDFIDSDMKKQITDAKKTINDAKKLLVSDEYNRAVLNTKYAAEDSDTYDFINGMKDYIGDREGIYVVGNSPMAVELSKTFQKESDSITVLTMIFIFVVVAITFKSLLIPFILVFIIQCAVYVTMGAITLMGGNVYFISLLIVQAILMGATIDYAIVYTSYYREHRLTKNIKDSVIAAYNSSIHTILSSSSILIIVTLVVANFASAIAAKICETISQGTLAAVILIVFILPGILSASDRFICRKGYYQEKKNKKIKA